MFDEKLRENEAIDENYKESEDKTNFQAVDNADETVIPEAVELNKSEPTQIENNEDFSASSNALKNAEVPENKPQSLNYDYLQGLIKKEISEQFDKAKTELPEKIENVDDQILSKEFEEFKRKKILSKVGGLIMPDISRDELKSTLEKAVSQNVRSIFLTARQITQAKHFVKNAAVSFALAVDFPFGCGLEKVRKLELKCVRRLAPDTVYLTVCGTDLTNETRKRLMRNIKSWKKPFKKIKFGLSCDMSKFGGGDVTKLGQFLTDCGVTELSVKICSPIENTVDNVRMLSRLLVEKCNITCFGDVGNFESAQKLLNAGASFIYSVKNLNQ